MTNADLATYSKKMISGGKTKEAIEFLLGNIESSNKNYNDLILISNRLEELKKQLLNGIILYEQSSVGNVQINYQVLSVIDNIVSKNNTKSEISNDLEAGLEKLRIISDGNDSLSISIGNTKEALNLHEKKINNWSKSFNFKDLSNRKSILDTYIELDYFVTPKKQHFQNENSNKCNIEDILKDNSDHIIILGQPGAGKTTTVKKLIQSNLSNNIGNNNGFKYLITIRLRELNSFIEDSLYPYFILENLFSIFGIKIKIQHPSKESSLIYRNEKEKSEKEKTREKLNYDIKFLTYLIINFLDDLGILLILDGFDEVREDLKKTAIEQIRELALGFSKSIFILTSRSGDFYFNIENSKEFEICSLNENQIREFIYKWIKDDEKSMILFNQIKKSPFADTAMRPLTLAHLCAIYERYGDIPEKPKTVYKKVVSLLIEEWDSQRGIKRKSKYAKFTPERKLEFLTHLSFHLSTTFSKSIFYSNDLKQIYLLINEKFNLPEFEIDQVVKEVETHNGLFLAAGFDQFEFSHKSLQEYLTAEYIVRLPFLPKEKIDKLPNEMAISIAISSDPNVYFTDFVLKYVKPKYISQSFIKIFLNRILLEKPDFSPQDLLGIGLLTLMSTQNLNFESDVENLFDILYSIPAIKKSISLGLEYYNLRDRKLEKRYSELIYNHKFKSIVTTLPPHRLKVLTKYLV